MKSAIFDFVMENVNCILGDMENSVKNRNTLKEF